MTFEELKAEAATYGYCLTKSQKGICTCVIPRCNREGTPYYEMHCVKYEPIQASAKWARNTRCRKKGENNDGC